MLKNRIQAKSALKTKLVPFPVPSWDETVHLKPLTAGELSDLLDEAQTDSHTADLRMVAISVRDESGTALFTVPEVRDLDPVGYGETLRRCTEINGLGKDSRDEKKAASDPTPT